jgi:threonine/homoserine/homoserine lactone efflux protein
MQEVIIATLLFWSAFVFSAGPFWIATMEAAPGTTFKKLYSDYFLYLIFGWLPVAVTCAILSDVIANIDENIFAAMHLFGGLYILFLAFKVLRAKITTGKPFDFNWKNMSIVTYLNPKVWILLPVGFLTAQLTESLAINIAFFYFSGIPMFLFGVYFWGMIGRAGAKISFKYISYFNAFLLAAFGLYLIYNGIILITNPSA